MTHVRDNSIAHTMLATLGRCWRRPVVDEEVARLVDRIDRRTPEEIATDTERLETEYGPKLKELQAFAAARLETVRWKTRCEVGIVSTTVPDRLDRMPWTRFHSYLLFTFAASWAVFGLQVGLGAIFKNQMALNLGIGVGELDQALVWSLIATGIGALGFGPLADRLGRRSVLLPSLVLYALGAVLTPFADTTWMLAACRIIAGIGIGGEYVAMTATLQEFMPKAERGRRCLAVHASFWLGAALGVLGSITGIFHDLSLSIGLSDPEHAAWRVGFGVSAALCLIVFCFRLGIKESPRWLASQGRFGAAERIVDKMEAMVPKEVLALRQTPKPKWFNTHQSRPTLARVWEYVRRERALSVVCFALMAAQASFYNGLCFANADILVEHLRVPPGRIDEYLLPILLGNFLGPVVLGRMTDIPKTGRRLTIFVSFLTSGVLLAVGVCLFHYFGTSSLADHGAAAFTFAWTAIFFFASAGASTIYLYVGEVFPQELRALAFAAVFFLTMILAGIPSSHVFEAIVHRGSIGGILRFYLFGAGLLVFAALIVTPDKLADRIVTRVALIVTPGGARLGAVASPAPKARAISPHGLAAWVLRTFSLLSQFLRFIPDYASMPVRGNACASLAQGR